MMQPTLTLTPGMSAADFALLGMDDVAYVRQAPDGSAAAWAIHAADGRAIGSAPSRELAFAAVVQNDLHPLSSH
jgi:hypothetical protein